MGETKKVLLESGHQLHVVVISCPPPGHALPCSQLAKKLAERGVAVSVVSSDLHVEELRADEINNTHANIRLVGLQDGSGCCSTTFWEIMIRQPELEGRLGGFLESLLVKMRDSVAEPGEEAAWGPPCCVIADMFTLGWSQDVARKLELECHALYPSPANALCFVIQLKKLILQGRVPVTPSNIDEVVTDLPGLPQLRLKDIPSGFFHDAPASGFNFSSRHFLRIPTSDVVLVNSFEELEEVALHGLRTRVLGSEFVKARSIYTVGLLCYSEETKDVEVAEKTDVEVDETGENEANPCLKWLNTQASESVIYIAFGSGRSDFSTEQFHELAKGLEASGQPFLWILRPPGIHASASSESSLHAVADLLPPGFLERVRGRALIYPGWAPQRDILGHPAVGGFLTHCGWNSTSETIVAGVPMIVWPLAAEQKITARFLVDSAKLAFECYNGDGKLREAAHIANLVKKLFQEEEGAEVRRRMSKMSLGVGAANDTPKPFNINGYVKALQRLHESSE